MVGRRGASDEERMVRLRLICEASPAGLDDALEFGLQDRDGALLPGRAGADGALVYEAEVRARPANQGGVRFAGLVVHGPAIAPFLYLSLRRRDGEPAGWLRRLKAPLAITWAQVEATSAVDVLEAVVSGVGSGTVPLLGGGWSVRPAQHHLVA